VPRNVPDYVARHTVTLDGFIVDDHEIVRRGLIALLADESDMRVVGQVGTVGEALDLVPQRMPDVAVLDIRLPDGDGVQLCRDLRTRCPQVRCMMLTAFADRVTLRAAIAAGAAGVVPKHALGAELTSAIRIVGTGGTLADAQPEQPTDPLRALTPRERMVLRLIGEGLTNRQIAHRLNLAEKTVKNYVSGVLGKLNVRRRTQAAVLATEVRHRM
jgi:DNA-binding NarL/FixJ family response regulator